MTRSGTNIGPGTPSTRRVEMSRAAGLRGRAGRALGLEPRGFTLLETLVAIGAVALVAVGLAAIFDSVGKTVTGGRRTSRTTGFASIIEGQLRNDIRSMVRDKGVLVIRQNVIQRVSVSPGNPGTKDRRADEILFFANGEFRSLRTPVHPEVQATSDTALIYYGHGARGRVNNNYQIGAAGLSNTHLFPSTGSYRTNGGRNPTNAPQAPGGLGQTGENRYAKDWTLLRSATLLVKPEKDINAVTLNGPNSRQTRLENQDVVWEHLGMVSVADRGKTLDRTTQYAMQPAAPSIFRTLAREMITDTAGIFAPTAGLIREGQLNEGMPARSSGLVDVAMGDLEEIRATIEGGLYAPNSAGTQPAVGFHPARSSNLIELAYTYNSQVLLPLGRFNVATLPMEPLNTSRPPLSGGQDAIDLMHAWMNDLFPAQSDVNPGYSPAFDPLNREVARTRMRYEVAPPALLEASDPGADNPIQATGRAWVQNYRLADQTMLSSSVFLPRCTEFIVDWSFGETFEADIPQWGIKRGDIIWHGPDREYSSTNPAVRQVFTRPYPFITPAGTPLRRHMQPFALRGDPSQKRYYEVSERLIYGYNAYEATTIPSWLTNFTWTSFFGTVDPSFRYEWPQRAQNGRSRVWAVDPTSVSGALLSVPPGAEDADGDGDTRNDATDAASQRLAWAWPKLLRVTVRLADPREPEREETFQYVFNVPEARE